MQIKTNNLTLETVTYGNKSHPCIMLIRGLGSQLIQWNADFIQRFVASGYFVVVFDNRDMGLSERIVYSRKDTDISIQKLLTGENAHAPYSALDMAQDVIDLMDTLEIDKAHIYGISLGGMISQILAHDYTDRVLSATIVMSSNGAEGLSQMLPEAIEALSAKVTLRTVDTMVDFFIEKAGVFSSTVPKKISQSMREGITALVQRGYDPDGQARQWLAILKTRHLASLVEYNKNTTVPCLVMHGEDDILIGIDHGRCIADTIPNAEFKSWGKWGHDSPPHMIEPLASAVLEFIKDK